MKTLPAIVSFLLLALFSATVCAEMYKHTDKDGVTTYSDKAEVGSTLLPPVPSNTIKLPKYTTTKSKPKPTQTSYSDLSILSPQDGTTLRDNTGSIGVTLALQPELDIAQGHSITLFLNGEIVVEKSSSLNHSITNVDRGSHTIYAVIYNSAKQSLIQSNSITVHIKRFSSLH